MKPIMEMWFDDDRMEIVSRLRVQQSWVIDVGPLRARVLIASWLVWSAARWVFSKGKYKPTPWPEVDRDLDEEISDFGKRVEAACRETEL